MATRYECDGCGVAACDLPDGVDPADVFLDAPEGRVLCQGCIMAAEQGSGTWYAPIRNGVRPEHDWEAEPIVVGDRPKTAADYWRDAQAGASADWEKAPTGGILGFSSEPFVQEYRPEQ